MVVENLIEFRCDLYNLNVIYGAYFWEGHSKSQSDQAIYILRNMGTHRPSTLAQLQ